ncbi:MAG: class I SAM-dependent methyltransferase [Verrucomicrobiota bacterium]
MRSAADFYQGLHTSQKAYSAGSYHLESLYSSRALNRWLSERRNKPMRILDVGCGKGLFLRDFVGALKSRWQITPARIVGLDLVRSPDDLFPEISDRFEFLQHDTDGNPLPFAAGSFDFLCCNHVLEHVFETEKLVREFRRVIAVDGLCLISVPNIAAWINRVTMLWAGQPLGTEIGTESVTYGFRPGFLQARLARFRPSGHIRDFTPHGLQDLTGACGFKTVGWWRQSNGLIARLGKWAGREMGILLQPAALYSDRDGTSQSPRRSNDC